MRHVIVLGTLLALLLLTAGVVVGVAVMDARKARSQLLEERTEYRKALADLEDKLAGIQAQAIRLASTKDEAMTAWRQQSKVALLTKPPTKSPPKSCRGIGGPR
jgi:hypothetical protein